MEEALERYISNHLTELEGKTTLDGTSEVNKVMDIRQERLHREI